MIFDERMMMFYNGSIKDNLNFKTICPLKEKEKTPRISYENGNWGIYFYPDTGELQMEEYGWNSLKEALLGVGGYSQICFYWEIYKLLFLMHNVNPVWVEVTSIDIENYDKVFIIYESG